MSGVSMYIFAVRDAKAGAYLNPFVCLNRAMAIRAFEDAVATDAMFSRHGEDYQLFEIGEWFPENGKIVGFDHEPLAYASDFVKKDNGRA